MAKRADLGGKRLIGLAPDAWLRWITDRADVVSEGVLGTELQWIGRETDAIIEAYSPEIGRFLALTELQLRYNSRVPWRVRAYSALAAEKFLLPVLPVLVNVLPPGPNVTIPSSIDTGLPGFRSLQEFKVINLWEVDVELVFQTPLPTLLPFVPILKGGGEESTVRRALGLLQANETLSELDRLLAFFASFVLNNEIVARIMRWDMTVLLESPWYNEIYQEGVGIGEDRATHRSIITVLDARFGAVAPTLIAELDAIHDADRLARLVRLSATTQSMDEFERAIRQ